MTIQKKVIISARRGLVEAIVCNRNEQEVGTRSRHERHQ